MSPREAPARALILAGGAGTRFWPASRAHRPKQLLPLSGDDALLVQTARRVLPLCGSWDHVLIASGAHLAAPTRAILPDLPRANLLVEPVPRNTAPCIGWAAAVAARTDPDSVLMVLPSDHHIGDEARFREVLATAVASARRGVVTTVGIRPTSPETGYGYIEVGGSLAGAAGGPAPFPVARFVEKPDRARAVEFLENGRYLWNAGMFFFRARDMLAAIRRYLPALAEGLDAFDRAAAAGREADEVARLFPTLPSVSIDYGVMEHLDEIAVVPGDFGWNDVGSWQSAWELAQKDERGNSAPAGAVLVDASNNHVVDLRTRAGDKRVIALVGTSDLVVVETDDALLVVPRSRAQDVKDVVAELKRRGDGSLV
jgi:mannose-1-phosphate guanylyltransferase